jgi:hypothetical protein
MQYDYGKNFLVKEKIELNAENDTIIKAYYLNNDTLAYRYKLYKGKPSGLYRVYHPNGKKKIQTIFINGQLNGEWKEFDTDGKLIITGQYDLGLKEGSWYNFEKETVEMYRDGYPRGRWRISEGWTPRTLYKYEQGVVVKTKRHFLQKDVF